MSRFGAIPVEEEEEQPRSRFGAIPVEEGEAEPASRFGAIPVRSDSWLDAIKHGIENTSLGIQSTAATYAGNADHLEMNAQKAEELRAGRTQSQEDFMKAFDTYADDEAGLLDAIGAGIRAVYEEPVGAGHETLAQTPNMAAALGGAWAGVKTMAPIGAAMAGPIGGTIGGVVGGILGMWAGNTAIETGFIAQEEAAKDGTLSEEDLEKIRKQGAIKAGVITAVDAATFGLSKWMLGAPGRAVEGAVRQTLAGKGVDLANDAAVKAALNSPDIVKEAIQAGNRALQASNARLPRLGRGAAVAGAETVAEGVGEYAGSAAAGLEASYKDAVLESLLATPMSATEIFVAKNMSQKPGELTAKVQEAFASEDFTLGSLIEEERTKATQSLEAFRGRMDEASRVERMVEERYAKFRAAVDNAQTILEAQSVDEATERAATRMEMALGDRVQGQIDAIYAQRDLQIEEERNRIWEESKADVDVAEAERRNEIAKVGQDAENEPTAMALALRDAERRRSEDMIANLRQAFQEQDYREQAERPPGLPYYPNENPDMLVGPDGSVRPQTDEERVQAEKDREVREVLGTGVVPTQRPVEDTQAPPSLPDNTQIVEQLRQDGPVEEDTDAFMLRAAKAIGQSSTPEEQASLLQSLVNDPDGWRNAVAAESNANQTATPDEVGVVEESTEVDQMNSDVPLDEEDELIEMMAAARRDAATSPENDLAEPTEGQKEKGNYNMGHPRLHGMDISIENPRGSTRSGTDRDGNAWSIGMAHDYGYIRRTEGADGDKIDVFVGPNPGSERVFVVDQVDEDGNFDEHKVMLGFTDQDQAEMGYLDNYEDGWEGMGSIKEMSVEEFKEWAKIGAGEAVTEPAADTTDVAPVEKVTNEQKPRTLSNLPAKKSDVKSMPGFEYFDEEQALSVISTNSASRETVINMTPDEFLLLAKKIPESSSERRDLDEHLASGQKFSGIPFLQFDNLGEGKARITGHEGRHRMAALKRAGVESVPVVLKSREGGGGRAIRWGRQTEGDNDYVDDVPVDLISEDGNDEVDFPVDFERAEPITDPAVVSDEFFAWFKDVDLGRLEPVRDELGWDALENASDVPLSEQVGVAQRTVEMYMNDEEAADNYYGDRLNAEEGVKETDSEFEYISWEEDDSLQRSFVRVTGDEGDWLIAELVDRDGNVTEEVIIDKDLINIRNPAEWQEGKLKQVMVNRPEPLKSQATGQRPQGISREDAEAATQDMVDAFPGVDIQFVGTNEIPRAVRKSIPSGQYAKGFVHNGKPYVVHDVLESEKDARVQVAHEVVGHVGVNEIVGDAWSDLVTEFEKMRSTGGNRFNELFDEVTARYPDATGTTLVQEFIAVAAEHREKQGAVGRFMTKVKTALVRGLRALGVGKAFSMSDIDMILDKSEDLVRSGSQGLATAEAFSISKEEKDEVRQFMTRYLSDEEAESLSSQGLESIKDFLDHADGEIVKQIAAFAFEGEAKRGWYQETAQAIMTVFDDPYTNDAQRFASLLAALSPQTSVESNLRNALKVWTAWVDQNRPQDRETLMQIMGENVEGSGTEKSVLDAWKNNAMRALTKENPLELSGPKVGSFAKNVLGMMSEITNDTWMARAWGVLQKRFGGTGNAKDEHGGLSGKSPGYLAANALTRKTAEFLTQKTGQEWTPAEVQETVWSFVKSIWEERKSRGQYDSAITMVQLLNDGVISDEMIEDTPDFGTLFLSDEFRGILEKRYGKQLEKLEGQREDRGPTERSDRYHGQRGALERGARRLEQQYRDEQRAPGIWELRKKHLSPGDGGPAQERESGPYRRRNRRNAPGVLATYSPLPEVRDRLKFLGASAPAFDEITSSEEFLGAINDAKGSNKFGSSVFVYEQGEYDSMRLFVTEDRKAGFALKGDDVVSVFNHSASPYSQVSLPVMLTAVQLGGRRADAFDTVLPDLYAQAGFRVVARDAWNDEFAPPDWDKDLYSSFNNGEPDIVYLVYDPDFNDEYKRSKHGDRVGSWGEAVGAQNDAISKTQFSLSLPEAKQQAAQEVLHVRAPFYRNIPERLEQAKQNFTTKFRQGVVDQYASIRDILGNERAWMRSQLSAGSAGAVEAVVEYGQLYLHKDGVIGVDTKKKSLTQVLEPLGDQVDEFLLWIAATRAEKLKIEGRENLFDQGHIQTLKSLTRDQKQLFTKVLGDFNELSNGITDIAVESGLLNREEAEVWKKDAFYLPFYRVLTEGESAGPRVGGGLVRQDAFKRLTGGQEKLDDLLGNTLANWNHLLGASMKNMAAREALASAEELGLAQKIKAREAHGRGQKAVYVREDGKESWYLMEDTPDARLVLDSLTALSGKGLDFFGMGAIRAFKRIFTYGVTASPEFKLANFLRDSINAMAATDTSVNLPKNWGQGYKAASKGSEMHAEMLASGAIFGDSGYIHGADPSAIKWVTKRAHSSLEGVSARDTILDSPRRIGQMWEAYQDWGARLENTNRSANYVQAIEKGDDKLTAAFKSRDHLDFSRTGSLTIVRFLTAAVPFLNARMQGLDKLGRAGFDKQQRKQFTTVLATYTLASIGLMMAMRGDDDYEEAEEWEKDTYHLFKLPGIEDTMFRIPRPFEVGAAAAMSERMFAWAMDDETTGELVGQRMGHAILETLSLNPIPHIAVPVIELLRNQDGFTKRPIETMSMDKMSSHLQKNIYTSETAVAAGELAHATGLSGLAEMMSGGQVDLSPVQIEHLVEGYLGWIGTTALAASDMVFKRARNAPKDPDWKWQEAWVAKRFARKVEPSRNTKYTTLFYDRLSEIETAAADYEQYRKLGQLENMRAHWEMEGNKIRLKKYYQRVQKNLRDINNQMKMIRRSSKSPKVKRQELDRLTGMKNRLTREAARNSNTVF